MDEKIQQTSKSLRSEALLRTILAHRDAFFTSSDSALGKRVHNPSKLIRIGLIFIGKCRIFVSEVHESGGPEAVKEPTNSRPTGGKGFELCDCRS